MAIVDVLTHKNSEDEFIWKYPDEELGTWTQLIVHEGQETLFLKDGKICDKFLAGKYVLSTKNIPTLTALLRIPFGGQSPFRAEVWFINKLSVLDIKWGTLSPIQLQDAKYNIFIPVRAFGQFGIRINNSEKFFTKLVGNRINFGKKDIQNYFKGVYLTKVRDILSRYIIQKRISILEINSYVSELSEHLCEEIGRYFEQYGIELFNFFINDINVSENDEGVERLKKALAKKAEMDIMGYNYMQERSFDTLEGVAKNTSSSSIASNFIGTGLGISLGKGIATTMNNDLIENIQIFEEKENKFPCKNCGKLIEKKSKFCKFCGNNQEIKCPKCGKIHIEKDIKFCNECGTKLLLSCENCGTIIEKGSKFCRMCGNKIGYN